MNERRRVLFLCTGNSARSQMAEGLLRHLAGDAYDVASAGVAPTSVRPEAIMVMSELGIDISTQRSQSVDEFVDQSFAYVITVCDNAKELCPVFPGDAELIHWSLDDPAAATGDEQERLAVFRRVRDEIADRLKAFIASQQRPAFACDITAIPSNQRETHLATGRALFSRAAEMRELPSGYEFRFVDDPDLIRSLVSFVSLEKLCCPFLNFTIEVAADSGPMWLRLTGAKGVKAFIREEISGIVGLSGFNKMTNET